MPQKNSDQFEQTYCNMDYEKEYNELVGKIKKAYLYAQSDSTKAVLEDILSELKESEDEKSKKATPAVAKLQKIVKEHCDEQMNDMFSLFDLFENSSEQSDKRYGFEAGFVLGIQWIGDILGIDLNPAFDEEKAMIDEIFK